MESADIVFIIVATLALLCIAAALPRGLLAVVFLTAIATVVVVVLFEVAPTRTTTGNAATVVVDHIKPRISLERSGLN